MFSAWCAVVVLAAAPDAGTKPECTRDTQCIIVFHAPDDCCACDPPVPFALPKLEVWKRSARCSMQGACSCPNRAAPSDVKPSEAPTEMIAVCRANKCTAIPKPPKRAH